MHVQTVCPQWGPYDKRALIVRREPMWTYLIVAAMDLLCRLSGHLWCNSRLTHWTIDLSDRHADTFTIPVDRGLLGTYCQWRDIWNVDSDDSTEGIE